jgi:hypothetical protein
MKTENYKWLTNWYNWIILLFLIYWAPKFITEYVRTRNSEYGRFSNERRQALGIPIIADYLKPKGSPKSKFDGLRWETSKNPTSKERLVHRWKTVEANKIDGWIEERDGLRLFIDDTTCFQLNLVSKIFEDSVEFSGKLGKVDLRRDGEIDVFKTYPLYEYQELNLFQIDSIRKTWEKFK